jgi:hypothetical protein
MVYLGKEVDVRGTMYEAELRRIGGGGSAGVEGRKVT